MAMQKSEVVSAARRRQARRRTAELPNAVEGHIAEICHDLAVQVKRMRQLQEQADELRLVIRQWAGESERGSGIGDRASGVGGRASDVGDSGREPASREGRRSAAKC
jgi:hypothetical protein